MCGCQKFKGLTRSKEKFPPVVFEMRDDIIVVGAAVRWFKEATSEQLRVLGTMNHRPIQMTEDACGQTKAHRSVD